MSRRLTLTNYMLDTSIVIDVFRGNEPLKQFVSDLDSPLRTCDIIAGELFAGAHKAKNMTKICNKWKNSSQGQPSSTVT